MDPWPPRLLGVAQALPFRSVRHRRPGVAPALAQLQAPVAGAVGRVCRLGPKPLLSPGRVRCVAQRPVDHCSLAAFSATTTSRPSYG